MRARLLLLASVGCSRLYVAPADLGPPVCAVERTVADTAPAFNLQNGHARVFVLSRPAADPAQQKLDAELLHVVAEQGGVLVDDPMQADLVVSAQSEDFAVNRENVEFATSTAHTLGSVFLTGGAGGWGLSSYTTVARVPLVITKQAALTKLHIDVFQRSDGAALRHVWSAELQAGRDAYRETPHECVNALFRRFGGPDGVL